MNDSHKKLGDLLKEVDTQELPQGFDQRFFEKLNHEKQRSRFLPGRTAFLSALAASVVGFVCLKLLKKPSSILNLSETPDLAELDVDFYDILDILEESEELDESAIG